MKRNLLVFLVICNLSAVIFSMEIDGENDWKKSYELIWFFQLLPEGPQNQIAGYLKTSKYEPTGDFENSLVRCKEEEVENKKVYIAKHEWLAINKQRSLKIFRKPFFVDETFLIRAAHDTDSSFQVSCAPENEVNHFAVSSNKKSVIALVDNLKLVTLNLSDRKNKTSYVLDGNGLADEFKNNTDPAQRILKTLKENEKILVSDGGREDWSRPKLLAISTDGNIAFATDHELFLANINEKSNVVFYKKIFEPEEIKFEDTLGWMEEDIYYHSQWFDEIKLNRQETIVGIRFSKDFIEYNSSEGKIKFIKIAEEPKRTMAQFMKERGVCKDWESQWKKAQENRDLFIQKCLQPKKESQATNCLMQ